MAVLFTALCSLPLAGDAGAALEAKHRSGDVHTDVRHHCLHCYGRPVVRQLRHSKVSVADFPAWLCGSRVIGPMPVSGVGCLCKVTAHFCMVSCCCCATCHLGCSVLVNPVGFPRHPVALLSPTMLLLQSLCLQVHRRDGRRCCAPHDCVFRFRSVEQGAPAM
jgi:hypothetical protein